MSDVTRKTQTKPAQTRQPAIQKTAPAPAAAATDTGMMQAAVGSPQSATPAAMLHLQRSFGNRAVQSLVQRAAPVGAEGGDLSGDVAGQVQSARGGGQPLDKGVGAKLGRSFGSDFSGVKVHTDVKSDSLNRSLNAKAFTLGSDIFFSRGAYSPGTQSGKHLLAHELTHVVQQGGSKPNKVQAKLVVGAAGDKYEQEADRVASQVMRSLSAPSVQPDEQGRMRRQSEPLRISRLSVQRTATPTIQRVFSLNPKKWFKTQKQIDDAKLEKEKEQQAKKDERDTRVQDGSKFERNLGKWLFNHPKAQGTAKVLNSKMMKAVIGDVDKDNEEHQKQIAATFGGKTKKYAGTVGTEFADVWGALEEGNLRERMTAFMNALFGPFKETMLKLMKDSAWEDAEKRGLSSRKLKIRKRQHGSKWAGGNLGAKTDQWIKDPELQGSKDIFRAPRNPLDRKKLGSNSFALLSGETRSEKPKGEDTLTTRTVGELEEGPHKAGLSDREKKFMFGQDRMGDDLSNERLSWEEGGSKWLIKDKSRWVKKFRDQLKMPVIAGPSGTALRFYQSYEWLNKPGSIKDLRLALLGWMLTENDHSFHEIMEVGVDYGLPYTPGQESYHFIDPLTTAELRKNANLDPQYPGLFPDEIAYHRKLDKGGYKLLKPYENEMEGAQHNLLAQKQFKMGGEQYKKAGLDKLLKNAAAYTSLPYQIQNIVASSSPLVAKVRISKMLSDGKKNTVLLSAMKDAYVNGKDVSTLSKEQQEALDGFKDWSFGAKNIMFVLMHNPDVTAQDLINESKEHNVMTNRAMSLLPTFAGTVYRGETNFGMPYKNGKVITISKFTSTSRNTARVLDYAKAKWPMTPAALEIKVKSGRDINAPTVNEAQGVKDTTEAADLDEVVILPGTKLKVTAPPAKDGRFGEVLTVHLEEVSPGDAQAKERGATHEALVKEMGEKLVSVYKLDDFKVAPLDDAKVEYELSGAQLAGMDISSSKTWPKGWVAVSWDGNNTFFWALEAEVKAAAPTAKIDNLDPEEPKKDVVKDSDAPLYTATRDITALAQPAFGAETEIASGDQFEILDKGYPGNVGDISTHWVHAKYKGREVYILAYDLKSGAKAPDAKVEKPPEKEKAKGGIKKIMLYMTLFNDEGGTGYEESNPGMVKSHAPDKANAGWSIVTDTEDGTWYARTAELKAWLGIDDDVEEDEVELVPEEPKDKADPKDFPAGRYNLKPDKNVDFLASLTDAGPLDQDVQVEVEKAKVNMSRFLLVDEWTKQYGRARYQYAGKEYWVPVATVAQLLGWPVAVKVEDPIEVVDDSHPEPDEESEDQPVLVPQVKPKQEEIEDSVRRLIGEEALHMLEVSDLDFDYIVQGHYVTEEELRGLTQPQREALADMLNVKFDKLNKELNKV